MSKIDPARWRAIDELLDRVLDAPDEDRERILIEGSAEDPSLRAEVEKLLAASEQAGERFASPPLIVASGAIREEDELESDRIGPDDVIGPWRIGRLLGRGGMGAVWQAARADGAFDKSVAIKIVKRGMDTDEIVRRFHQERRILARLQHPNIAGLIDGGVTNDGLPYFVMELAEGDPIDDWCDTHTLLIRERLRLFRTVCEAVQYAHGNLIVHRDLKPGNVIVSKGEVKLLDFGIAKLLGEDAGTAATQAHEARLTPRYAAPEQVKRLATSTATDVYSLGVVLYELLAGRPPYRLSGKTLLEMEVVICNDEPMRPSAAVTRMKDEVTPDEVARRRGLGRPESLHHILRGDLDAICLKALRKAPEERYVSAIALADDIERYLDGRPVRAVPPSRTYQLRKFVRRNFAAVTFASITAVALIGATVMTTLSAREATRQGVLRQQEAERATVARDFIVSTLGSFDPDAGAPQPSFTARDLIERGRSNLDALAVQPLLRATVMNTLGQVAFNLGERHAADSLFHAAFATLDSMPESTDKAVSMMGVGEVLQRDGRFQEATEWYGRALELRRKLLPPDDHLIAESQHALAFAHYNMGSAASDSVAERLYTGLLAWPDSAMAVRAGALEGLADLQLKRGMLEQADTLYNRVLGLRSAAQRADHPDVARTLWGIASVRVAQGRYPEAEALCRRALAILEAAYDEDHRDVAFAYNFLGLTLRQQNRNEEAAAEFLKEALVSERVNAPGHGYTVRAWYYHGEQLARSGDMEAAERALQRARDIAWIGGRSDTSSITGVLARTDSLMALLLEDQRRFADAVIYLRELFSLPVDSARRDRTAARLARAFERTGQRDSAGFYRLKTARRD